MSDHELRLAFCAGKETLPNWGIALRRAKQKTRVFKGEGLFFSPYRCRYCGGIHIGSTDKVAKQRRTWDDGDVPGYPGHEHEVVY